ncbi:MAG: chaperone protein DnaJ [Bacteroidetes bacterium]|nr:chaperone protein DnaJ [Bacteroidota bacterium]
MVNYYDILGLQQEATPSEIKTAFRSLAKLYHPDKNPNGQELFKKILRAYETLSNPARKSSYDIKLKYHQNSAQTLNHAKSKHWSFDEKELKRRQYYNEHIKKYEKVKTAKAAHAELKTNYNEYKYILYATPVAVALFLFVIHFATPSHVNSSEQHKKTETLYNGIITGEALYTDYFGPQKYSKDNTGTLNIKNGSGEDVIVCLFLNNSFLRSCVVKDGYYAEIGHLPAKPIRIKLEVGKNWDPGKAVPNVGIKGLFAEDLKFLKSKSEVSITKVTDLFLMPGFTDGFEISTLQEFFNKGNI